MRIAGTEYNLNHKALEIYLSGCKAPHCPGCHNEELWDFGRGARADRSILNVIDRKLSNKIATQMVEKVWIMGGEPLDQDLNDLIELMAKIHHWRSGYATEFWIWTRYDTIPEKVIQYFTHAKIGPYYKNLQPYLNIEHGITLASSNQKIIKLDKPSGI